jgi:class 3 adenylate cyclase
MNSSTVQRRLAAILAADVVGYSRLMGTDEVGTLAALKAHRRELIDPEIAAHHGRMVKTTGDGALVEFASVVDAVGCAVAIQRGMVNRNANVGEDNRIVFRIGINVGDIIIDGDDIFGDGVNIAARLETLCEPGRVCISRAANEQIRGKLSLAFADLGEQTVKNIAHAIGVFGLSARDIEVLPEPDLPRTMPDVAKPQLAQRYEQKIQFCMTSDGVQLAYARTGNGPSLVKTGNWMTHLEFDFESPIWRRLYRELSRDHTLIRYDARGNGLSDRDIEEVSQEVFVSDLEAIVDAAGLERFALLGISQGCAVSIAYAVAPSGARHASGPVWRIPSWLGQTRGLRQFKMVVVLADQQLHLLAGGFDLSGKFAVLALELGGLAGAVCDNQRPAARVVGRGAVSGSAPRPLRRQTRHRRCAPTAAPASDRTCR